MVNEIVWVLGILGTSSTGLSQLILGYSYCMYLATRTGSEPGGITEPPDCLRVRSDAKGRATDCQELRRDDLNNWSPRMELGGLRDVGWNREERGRGAANLQQPLRWVTHPFVARHGQQRPHVARQRGGSLGTRLDPEQQMSGCLLEVVLIDVPCGGTVGGGGMG